MLEEQHFNEKLYERVQREFRIMRPLRMGYHRDENQDSTTSHEAKRRVPKQRKSSKSF